MITRSIKKQGFVNFSIIYVTLLALIMMLGSVALGQEIKPPPSKEAAKNTIKPDQLLKLFKKEIIKTPDFKLCSNLKLKDVKEILKSLEKELDVQFKPFTSSFLKWIAMNHKSKRFNTTLAGEWEAWITLAAPYRLSPSYILNYRKSGDKKIQTYNIPTGQLPEFKFEFVEDLNIIDPANKVLPELKVHKEPLLSIVDKLCKLGKLEYAIEADQSNDITIIMQVRNKTIANCLAFASKAGGYEVHFQRNNATLKPRQLDKHFSIFHWFQLLGLLDSNDSSKTKYSSVQQLLKKEILNKVKKMLSTRPVVFLVKRNVVKQNLSKQRK